MSGPSTIAVSNQKGGVGKTASVLAFVEAAVRAGLRVGVIDLDPNCTATETLEPADLDAAGSKDLLRDDQKLALADCLVDAGADWPGVSVCASDPLLSNREYDLTGIAAEDRLRTAIRQDPGEVDLILIDLPPARSRIALTGLVASDAVIVPTTASTYSVRSMAAMFDDFLPNVRKYNPDLVTAGIMITKFAGRAEERRVLGEMVQLYGDLVWDPPIPRHEIVATAFESLHVPLRSMSDGYATKVAEAYDTHLPSLLAAVGQNLPKRRRRGN